MMGGVLEIKKEDELKKVWLPPPPMQCNLADKCHKSSLDCDSIEVSVDFCWFRTSSSQLSWWPRMSQNGMRKNRNWPRIMTGEWKSSRKKERSTGRYCVKVLNNADSCWVPTWRQLHIICCVCSNWKNAGMMKQAFWQVHGAVNGDENVSNLQQLEMELKKLQGVIQEGSQLFDDTLNQLFHVKIGTEMAVYQEELKILRLRHSLLLEEELDNREKELTELLDFKKEMKVHCCKKMSGIFITLWQLHAHYYIILFLPFFSTCQVKPSVKLANMPMTFVENYDLLVAEDRVMDKAFKRDFSDISALQVDQLYRLFKKRPRCVYGGWDTRKKGTGLASVALHKFWPKRYCSQGSEGSWYRHSNVWPLIWQPLCRAPFDRPSEWTRPKSSGVCPGRTRQGKQQARGCRQYSVGETMWAQEAENWERATGEHSLAYCKEPTHVILHSIIRRATPL